MATQAELQAQYDALQAAYATGAKSTTVDGVTTTYRSSDEMERALRHIKKQLTASKWSRPLAFKVNMG